MLGPELLPRRPGELPILHNHGHLRVVEEGALVQVGRPDSHPLVIDDRNLGVYVDRSLIAMLVGGEERAGQEPIPIAVGLRQRLQDGLGIAAER